MTRRRSDTLMPDGQKTLRELIALGDAYLLRHAVPDARVVCELLAARLFKCGRMELFRHGDGVPPERIVEALRRGLQRVAQGEPVQYVLGQWDFRSLTLKVDRRALIPRPETEQLVDLVLRAPQVKGAAKPLVVDVGTGSGCIILSLAKELAAGVFVGLDISPDALSLARENAAFTGLADRVLFAESDGCGEFEPASVDVLVSNPPYIPAGERSAMAVHVTDHEPHSALFVPQDDPLLFYRAIARANLLRKNGWLYFEVHENHAHEVCEMLLDEKYADVELRRDMNDKTRMARCRKK